MAPAESAGAGGSDDDGAHVAEDGARVAAVAAVAGPADQSDATGARRAGDHSGDIIDAADQNGAADAEDAAAAGPREAAVRRCPDCAAEAADSDLYCEECGTVLDGTTGGDSPSSTTPPGGSVSLASGAGAAPLSGAGSASLGSTVSLDSPAPGRGPALARTGRRCPACDSAAVDDDGYCLGCGLLLGSTRPGDHVEVDLGQLAGVSDRGLVHRDNEDAMSLRLVAWPSPAATAPTAAAAAADRGGPWKAAIAVVCDGVSTVPGSGPAAGHAARAAASGLAKWLAAARPDAPAIPEALHAAAERARLAMPAPAAGEPAPACTFAAAVVTGTDLTVGWLGDSRAYLLGSDGALLRLTADDTLAAEAARAGLIPLEAAESAVGAHTITRWLGPDRREARPRTATVPVTGPGRVVLCTDGLWNYASGVTELAEHVARLPAGASALDVARHLTTVALRAGGRDNITVAVIDIVPGRG